MKKDKDIDIKKHGDGRDVDIQPDGSWCRINEDLSQTEYGADGKPKKDGYTPPPTV